MKFEELEYTIPEFILCYLEYGDKTGMEDEEIKAVDNFLKDEELTQASFNTVSAESYFSHYHDIPGILPGTVVDVVFHKPLNDGDIKCL